MDPSTETGHSLLQALTNLDKNKPETVGPFQRLVFMYSPKIVNEDAFITYLYGQGAVDQLPLDLIQQLGTPSPLLRLQHAIDTCFKSQCNQELIVALEWSENTEVLTHLLNWASNETKSLEDSEPEVDHVKQPAEEKQQNSENTGAKAKMSTKVITNPVRTITWDNCENLCSMVVTDDYILLVREEEIGIYNREHLACTAILKTGDNQSFYCVATNSENVIACCGPYTYVWELNTGKLVTGPVNTKKSCYGSSIPSCVKYRKTEIILGTGDGDLSLWRVQNRWLSVVRTWGTGHKKSVKSVGLDERLVISLTAPKCLIQVWNKDGTLLRQLTNVNFESDMKYLGGRIVTNYKDMLRFWDPSTLECSDSLECRNVLALNEKFAISWDYGESVSIWSLEAVLGAAADATVDPVYKIKLKATLNNYLSKWSVGNNFVVCYPGDRKSVEVLEFE